jgi:hypothetical protein
MCCSAPGPDTGPTFDRNPGTGLADGDDRHGNRAGAEAGAGLVGIERSGAGPADGLGR